MRLALLVLLIAFAGASSADDVWQTAPGQFRESDTLTVRQLSDGMISIEIRTVFCPTNNDCMNARIRGMEIQGKYGSGTVRQSKPNCDIEVVFSQGTAVVHMRGCRAEFPYGGPRNPFRPAREG
jgi:hypothetical protein